jgi:hypothetical protein
MKIIENTLILFLLPFLSLHEELREYIDYKIESLSKKLCLKYLIIVIPTLRAWILHAKVIKPSLVLGSSILDVLVR